MALSFAKVPRENRPKETKSSKAILFFFLSPVEWRKFLYFVTVPNSDKASYSKGILFLFEFQASPVFMSPENIFFLKLVIVQYKSRTRKKQFAFDVAFIDSETLKTQFSETGEGPKKECFQCFLVRELPFSKSRQQRLELRISVIEKKARCLCPHV